MKIGFVSAILPELTFEEVIDFAASEGFEAVELACWPKGKSERRYAGVTHIDVEELTESRIEEIKKYSSEKGIEISALAYYPNNMDKDLEKRKVYNEHLIKLFTAAKKLDIKMVNTFIGRVTDRDLDYNLSILNEVWDPIIAAAKSEDIKVGIENCPMYFTYDEWPAGQNLFSSPHNWDKIFAKLNTDVLGINYDPSHQVLQGMDYVKPMLDYKDKLFHLHFKDITIVKEKLNEYGYFAPPNKFSVPKIPGHGDINWGKFVAGAYDSGFRGYACIEVEDRNFEESLESRKKSLSISRRYLKQYF